MMSTTASPAAPQPQPKKATLNAALLSHKGFGSAALSLRGSLFHRFAKPGRYEVFVYSGARVVHRELLDVAEGRGVTQLDVSLGLADHEAQCNCGGRSAGSALLQSGGVMAFYATSGTAQYRVRIERWEDKGKFTELDSRETLPAGDLFAATLVVPGLYRVLLGKQPLVEVTVRQPDPHKPHRTDQPLLLRTGKGTGHKPVVLDAGASLVLWLDEAGSVRVEPVELLGEKVAAA